MFYNLFAAIALSESANFLNLLKEKGLALFHKLGPRIIVAIIVGILGIFIIKWIKRILWRLMDRSKTEMSLRKFIESLSTLTLYVILIFCIGVTLGIKISAFFTIFGAAGIAVGLALQGSLSNFAGGLLILVFKPFHIGDEVEIDGIQGEVVDINILYTRINNWRGEVFTLPNGRVSNNYVKNNSAEPVRRVQIELHFPHDADIDRLREIITTTMKKHPTVVQDKPFQFWINNFQDYYIKTSARCWAKREEYWSVYWAQEEAIKKALAEHDIKLAIPARDIYQPDLAATKPSEKQ